MTKNFDDFLMDLALSESGNNYEITNKQGFLGKYQMGEMALVDAGYYKKKVKNLSEYNNDWTGSFTGKDGVYSVKDFLNNQTAQENAQIAYKKAQWGYLKNLGAHKYLGETIAGIKITQSGLLGGAHLGGQGRVDEFLRSGGKIDKKDGNGVPVSHYIRKFAGYDVSNITGLPSDSDESSSNSHKPESKQKKDEQQKESVKSEKGKQEIKQEPERSKDNKNDISSELALLAAELAGGVALSPAMMFSNLIRAATKNKNNKIFEDIFERHLRLKNEAGVEKYKNYKNPETGENKIYTKEAINKMSDSEYQKHKKAITAQKLRIGIPSHKEMENISKSGGGVVFVNDYTRSDGTHVGSYWRSAPH